MKRNMPGKIAEETDMKQDNVDDVTRKKIRKHLSDIDDVITDDDIRNATVAGAKKPASKRKKTETKTPAKANGIKVEPEQEAPPTSWNILEG